MYWGLRRDELCDKNICPHEESGKPCPLDDLQAAERSEPGQLLRRALDLRALLKLGLNPPLEDIAADELYAMLIVEEERNRLENDKDKEG